MTVLPAPKRKLDFSRAQTLESFVQKATALPGIGPWTAHYMALRAMGLPDAFPAGDLVLQQVLGGEGQRLSEREGGVAAALAAMARLCGAASVASGGTNRERIPRQLRWPRMNTLYYDRFDNPIGALTVAVDQVGVPPSCSPKPPRRPRPRALAA